MLDRICRGVDALFFSAVLFIASSDAVNAEAAADNPAAVNQARLENAAAEPGNWMSHGRTYAEQRFSPLERINAGNIGDLDLAWYYEFDTSRGQEATPIVVDGVMYVTSAWSKVYAFDAATGERLWKYDPQVPGAAGMDACCDVVNRGVAVWKGKVFVGTLDGRLVALDAETGAEVWSVMTVPADKPYTITGAPRVFKDKVVIGNGGAELGVRGYVSAYDAATGDLAWRFYTVPGNPKTGPDGAASDAALENIARETWHGEWWQYGGGGTVWDSITYDPELDQLYLGVGNGSPWNHRIRSNGKGDNLFLASIVAVDPDTGEYLWHYQANPGETWDFTNTQQMTLATLDLGNGPKKVLMQAPKNGFFYIIDRTNGELLSAENYVPVNWASGIDMKTGRPIETAQARYDDRPFLSLPSGVGAHAWQPMAYSPETGLVYIPAMQVPLTYANDESFVFRPGRWNTGVNFRDAPVPPGLPDEPEARQKALAAMTQGSLLAWNPRTQEAAWRHTYEDSAYWHGGTLATAGNLVFQGNADGEFQAFAADSGERLWSFQTRSGILAGPVTYTANGQQYVAVLSGYGGSQGIARPKGGPYETPNGMLLAFRLNGDAELPPYERTPLPPPNPPSESFTEAQIDTGADLYTQFCGICHSGSITPDLRRSNALSNAEVWRSIVLGGALEAGGMGSFANDLSPKEAEAVRAYIAAEARKLKKETAAD